MAVVTVKGLRLSYRRMGDGPDVVFIHGAAANMAFWRAEVLQPLTRDFRITLYDLRGHGYSDGPPSGYTTGDMASDLDGLLDALAIDRAHLVGHSFGGGVALHHAVLHGERVLSLALADAKVAALQPAQPLAEWAQSGMWLERLRALGIPVSGESTIDHSLLEIIAQPEWQEARQRVSDRDGLFLPFAGWNGGRRTAQRWLRLLGTTTAREEFGSPAGLTADTLRTVRQPMLAIYGEYSHCLHTFDWLRGNVSSCRAVICPGVGHFHPAVRPAAFGAHLARFLRDVQAGRAAGTGPAGLDDGPSITADAGDGEPGPVPAGEPRITKGKGKTP